jgi:hypothetical protein
LSFACDERTADVHEPTSNVVAALIREFKSPSHTPSHPLFLVRFDAESNGTLGAFPERRV